MTTTWLIQDLTVDERDLLGDIAHHGRDAVQWVKHGTQRHVTARDLARLRLIDLDGDDSDEVAVMLTDEAEAWVGTLAEGTLDGRLAAKQGAPTDPTPNLWLVSYRGRYTRTRLMGRGKRDEEAQFIVRGATSEAAIEKARKYHGSGIDPGLDETWSAIPI